MSKLSNCLWKVFLSKRGLICVGFVLDLCRIVSDLCRICVEIVSDLCRFVSICVDLCQFVSICVDSCWIRVGFVTDLCWICVSTFKHVILI